MASEFTRKLQSNLDALLPHFELSPEDLKRTYEPGKWNIRQLLAHIVDAETVLTERIKRGICEPKLVVYGFQQDLWAKELDYENFPLDIQKDVLLASRKSLTYLGEQFYMSHGSKQYVHSESGLRNVKQEFDKIIWHAEHHLSQIQTALKS